MKISFLTSPQRLFSRFPMSSRILTSNLANSRFDVSYHPELEIKVFLEGINKIKNFKFDESAYSLYLKRWCGFGNNGNFPVFNIYSGDLNNYILSKIKTEVVFFTAFTALDFHLIKMFLDDGRYVVLGGSMTSIYTFKQIRKYLEIMNCSTKKLLIVRGYVDLKTDLYKIFENKKDYVITDNNFDTFYKCEDDYLLSYVRVIRKVFNSGINLIFNLKCEWNRCTYCSNFNFCNYDFLGSTSAKDVIEYVKRLGEIYQTKQLHINDNVIFKENKIQYILGCLSDENFSIMCNSEINYLRDPEYVKYLNQFNINTLYIGMEHVDNFTLKFINQIHRRKNIVKAIEVLKKNMKRNTKLVFHVMVDLPVESEDKIVENYNFMVNMKESLNESGLDCIFALIPLRDFSETNFVDNNLLRHSDDNLIGLQEVYRNFNKIINMKYVMKQDIINRKISRFFPNGKATKPDFYYLDRETALKLTYMEE